MQKQLENNYYIPLEHRSIIRISGKDRVSFLQGLVSNDVSKVAENNSIYALMLTPQGKYLYDFFISERENSLWIDCSKFHKSSIIKKLSMYKLRSDVSIDDVSSEFEVVALLGNKIFEFFDRNSAGFARQFCKGVAYIDPRSELLYARSFIERENNYQSFICHDLSLSEYDNYEILRINSGVPDGDNDMVSTESFPLDFAMDSFNAIDYKKGCYVGQEVTARVHYRGKVRKKPYSIELSEEIIDGKGKVIIDQDNKKVGLLCGVVRNKAIALLSIESAAESKKNTVKDFDITVTII